jgi:hypothetical protein
VIMSCELGVSSTTNHTAELLKFFAPIIRVGPDAPIVRVGCSCSNSLGCVRQGGWVVGVKKR